MNISELEDCNSSDVYRKPATCLVSIVGSAGAFQCIRRILGGLPLDFNAAVVVAIHTGPGSLLARTLALRTRLPVCEAVCGDLIENGRVYVAPPRAHLIVNPDARLTVSLAPPRRLFRPSADWLLESASAAFGDRHVAVVVSGLLSDGAKALAAIKRSGGLVIAQNPADAAYPDMPAAAIATGHVDVIASTSSLADAVCAVVTARDTLRDARLWETPFDISAA
jgi:two-component system chemotaxis response regulator CheB